MVLVGWYCIEVTTYSRADVVFTEEKIVFGNINSKIYRLNKHPIPDGQSLSVADWTERTITSDNVSDIMLNPGIYWYQVIKGLGSKSDEKDGDIILDLDSDILITVTAGGALVHPQFIGETEWLNALSGHRAYNTYGPPDVAEDDWGSYPSMISILHNSKAYIGWELEGNFVYDYTKEYTLTYSVEHPGKMNIEVEGAGTFAEHIIATKTALLYTNVEETFDIKARFGFTHFEKREVIVIPLNGVDYYLFNHADSNIPSMNEISFIRNQFIGRVVESVTDVNARHIFNKIIAEYWIRNDNDNDNGGSFALEDIFTTDIGGSIGSNVHTIKSKQYMILAENSKLSEGDISNNQYLPAPMRVTEDDFFDTNEIRSSGKVAYYYLAKGTLLNDSYITILRTLPPMDKPQNQNDALSVAETIVVGSAENNVLSEAVVVGPGTLMSVQHSGDGTTTWIAPVGTTNFESNETTITTADGNSPTIMTPTNAGTYYIYVKNDYGVSQPSSISIMVVVSAAVPLSDTFLVQDNGMWMVGPRTFVIDIGKRSLGTLTLRLTIRNNYPITLECKSDYKGTPTYISSTDTKVYAGTHTKEKEVLGTSFTLNEPWHDVPFVFNDLSLTGIITCTLLGDDADTSANTIFSVSGPAGGPLPTYLVTSAGIPVKVWDIKYKVGSWSYIIIEGNWTDEWPEGRAFNQRDIPPNLTAIEDFRYLLLGNHSTIDGLTIPTQPTNRYPWNGGTRIVFSREIGATNLETRFVRGQSYVVVPGNVYSSQAKVYRLYSNKLWIEGDWSNTLIDGQSKINGLVIENTEYPDNGGTKCYAWEYADTTSLFTIGESYYVVI